MPQDNTAVSLNVPTDLVEKLDTIAKQKFQNRDYVIIDALAFYCQFHDMNSERLPETMRSIFFNLARHDGEFRTLLRQIVQENPVTDADNS